MVCFWDVLGGLWDCSFLVFLGGLVLGGSVWFWGGFLGGSGVVLG